MNAEIIEFPDGHQRSKNCTLSRSKTGDVVLLAALSVFLGLSGSTRKFSAEEWFLEEFIRAYQPHDISSTRATIFPQVEANSQELPDFAKHYLLHKDEFIFAQIPGGGVIYVYDKKQNLIYHIKKVILEGFTWWQLIPVNGSDKVYYLPKKLIPKFEEENPPR